MCEVVQNQVVSKWDQEMANGTPLWAHPFKSRIPWGLLRRPLIWEARLFLLPVPGMKLEHRLYALASNVLNPVLANWQAFICDWRTDWSCRWNSWVQKVVIHRSSPRYCV